MNHDSCADHTGSNVGRITRRTDGFTLIELLVVISIIAVLIALLLPALDRARGEAQAIMCMALHRQWALAFVAYSEDNNDEFPLFASSFPAPAKWSYWHHTTSEYLGVEPRYSLDSEVRRCPTGQAGVGVPYGLFKPVRLPPPAYTPRPYSPIVYGNNGAIQFGEIRNPAAFAMLLDTDIQHHFMYTYSNWHPQVDTDGDMIPDTNSGLVPWIFAGAQYNGARPRVHRDSFNMALVDGHVERLDYPSFVSYGKNLVHRYFHDF